MITPELRAAQEAALAGLKARCDERRKAEEAELARQAAQDRRAAALASQVVDALRPFNGWLVKGQARNCPTGPVTLTDTAEVAYGVSRTTARRRVEFRPHWDDLCVKVEAEEGVDTSHWGLIAHGAQQAIGTAADLPVLVRAVGARLADLCVGPAPAVVLPPLPPDPEGWHRVFQYTGEHKLFTHADCPGWFAVADNSGKTPDKTQDGVLWIDTTRLMTEEDNTGRTVRVPLVDPSGRQTATPVGSADAERLADITGLRFQSETAA